jgi:hypothetical protein
MPVKETMAAYLTITQNTQIQTVIECSVFLSTKQWRHIGYQGKSNVFLSTEQQRHIGGTKVNLWTIKTSDLNKWKISMCFNIKKNIFSIYAKVQIYVFHKILRILDIISLWRGIQSL